jgi:hypothetical protein
MINKLELLTKEPVVDGTMKSHRSKYKLPKNAAKQIEYNCKSIINIIKRSHVSIWIGYRQERICYQRRYHGSYSLSTHTMYKIGYDVRYDKTLTGG